MLSAINFNHHSFFQTHKINEVGPDRSLPAKFVSGELTQPNMAPKQALRVCRMASQLSRSRCSYSQIAPILTFPRDGGRNRNNLNRKPKHSVAIPLSICQRQLLIHFVHRPFRVGAMLAGPGAAARMMGDFHQRQTGDAEELRFGSTQFHKNRLAQSDRRLTMLLQFDGVVDTPRCTRPSGA